MRERIIYTGAFRFPEGDAAATRVYFVGKCLREIGYEVEYLAWGAGKPQNDVGNFDGFDFSCSGDLRERKRVNIFVRTVEFLFIGRRALVALIGKRKRLHQTKAIFVYNPSSFFALSVCVLSLIYKFKVVLDSTEWYQGEHLPGGKFGPASLENSLRMRFFYGFFRNVIAISTFLTEYYEKSTDHKNVMNIPAMVDLDDKCNPGHAQSWRKREGTLSIIFAGTARKKDDLSPLLLALPGLNRVLSSALELHLYGPEREEVSALLGSADFHRIMPFLVFHGKVSRTEVLEAYDRSCFSVIFRENERYAEAGFPTKAVESWSRGVPIITNGVGDLGLYCTPDNSILVPKGSVEDKLLAFFSAYTDEIADNMSRSSIQTAREYFAWQANVDKIATFIQNIK